MYACCNRKCRWSDAGDFGIRGGGKGKLSPSVMVWDVFSFRHTLDCRKAGLVI